MKFAEIFGLVITGIVCVVTMLVLHYWTGYQFDGADLWLTIPE